MDDQNIPKPQEFNSESNVAPPQQPTPTINGNPVASPTTETDTHSFNQTPTPAVLPIPAQAPQVVDPLLESQQTLATASNQNAQSQSVAPNRAVIYVLAAISCIVFAIIGIMIGYAFGKSESTTSSKSTSVQVSTTPAANAAASTEQNSRNVERETDIRSLQTQLEAFFAQNGYYPSLTDMNTASWRAVNMKSLDSAALGDPKSTCNPVSGKCLVAAPVANSYAYGVTDGSGASCEATDTNCAKYTLTATFEGTFNGVRKGFAILRGEPLET